MDVDPHAEAHHEAVRNLDRYANYIQHDLLTRLGAPSMHDLKDHDITGAVRLWKRIEWAKKRLEAVEFIRTP